MKHILVFDVETTGLPIRNNDSSISDGKTRQTKKRYPDPSDFTSYKDARIVQITFSLLYNNQIQLLSDYIIRPTDFEINNSHIHGISQERALIEGSSIEEVLNLFKYVVSRADILIAHNLEFDYNILSSECLRINRKDIVDIMNTKIGICTMKSTTELCKIPGKFGYKYPKLCELYKYLFNQEPENCHNSKYDVLHTIRCFNKLYEMKLFSQM